MKKDIVDWDSAYALYTAGASLKEVAGKVGCSSTTLCKGFRSLGFIDRHTRGARPKRAPAAFKLSNPACEADAYWLGFLFADGCLQIASGDGARPGTVTLVSGLKDTEHTRKFAEYMDGYIYTRTSYVAAVSKRSMDWRELLNVGFGVGKTARLDMPKLPAALVPHFIRGFFDGDGWATMNKAPRVPQGRAGFTSVSRLFLEQLMTVLHMHGIEAGIRQAKAAGSTYTIKGKTGLRKVDVWDLLIVKIDSFSNFYKYLYTDATLYLSRKKDKFAEVIQYRANDCLNKQSLRNA